MLTSNVVNNDDALNIDDPIVNNYGNALDYCGNDGNCNHSYHCYCGRYFYSFRGLNVHRMSCFITEQHYLNDLLVIRGTSRDY